MALCSARTVTKAAWISASGALFPTALRKAASASVCCGTSRPRRPGPPGATATTRTGDNARGAKTTQKTTTTSAAGASHHSQPSRQHGVVLFRDGSPRGSIRHHELLTERPIIACGSEFPLPPPAGPPGPDPPPASASRLAHPSARSLPRSICWPERPRSHGLPSLHAPDILALLMRQGLSGLEAWAQRERRGAPIVRSHCSRTEERTALYCDEPKSAEHVRVE